MTHEELPLLGVKVLDFSTLLPGPMASLMLAEAGADVIKFEKPGTGDAMRLHTADFALLNRGKKSVMVDLKDPASVANVRAMLPDADVVIEQFRPGVMERLGLGYQDALAINPCVIYCSINGYGSQGEKALAVGHDLNYVADAGLLSLSLGADGAPVMPTTLVADIGGGAYPAVINILLALLRKKLTGKGARIEIAMAENTLPFLYPAHASAFGRGHWPGANDSVETGASPRYNLYRTSDDRYVAAAPVEQKFWEAFCELIDLPVGFRSAKSDLSAVRGAVEARILQKTAAQWQELFKGKDVACTVVKTFQEAMDQLHRDAKSQVHRQVTFGGKSIKALPIPIVNTFRRSDAILPAPALGEHTGEALNG